MIDKEALDQGFINRCASRGITEPSTVLNLMKVANEMIIAESATRDEQVKQAAIQESLKKEAFDPYGQLQELMQNKHLMNAIAGGGLGALAGAGAGHMMGYNPYMSGAIGGLGGAGAGYMGGEQLKQMLAGGGGDPEGFRHSDKAVPYAGATRTHDEVTQADKNRPRPKKNKAPKKEEGK